MEVSNNLLENLYVINKHAKDYNNRTHVNDNFGYSNNEIDKLRKEALYRMKSDVLNEIKEEADSIELHIINSEEYYCFYFGEWSFHLPEDEFEVNDVDCKDVLYNFESDEVKSRSNIPLRKALNYFRNKGINANEYLENKYISSGNQTYFSGWPYL
jgi:hypothetical protein